MNEVLKKERGKCVPIVITPEIREQIKFFKERLLLIYDDPTMSSEFDVRTIDIIFNELDDYDRNLLFAYYAIADCKYSNLAKLFNVSQPVILRKITTILNKIKELNDTIRTPNNEPRCYPDN